MLTTILSVLIGWTGVSMLSALFLGRVISGRIKVAQPHYPTQSQPLATQPQPAQLAKAAHA